MSLGKNPINAQESPSWMSVSESLSTPPGTLSISVIMEASFGSQYAGIQLILVEVELPDGSAAQIQRSKIKAMFSVKDSSSIRRNRSRPPSELPFYTVVLGVEFLKQHDENPRPTNQPHIYYKVAPMSEATAPRTLPSSRYTSQRPQGRPKPIAILIESCIPWGTRPDDSYGYSINVTFARKRSSLWADSEGGAFAVHISRCHPDRAERSLYISPEIMLHIGRYLTKSSHMLAAALVSKSWFPIMKNFFRKFGWSKDSYIYSLDRLAGAIKKHSEEWGSQITALDLQHQQITQKPRFYVNSFAAIIDCAPNLRMLAINLLVFTRARDPISRLQHLQALICSSYGMDLPKDQIPGHLISFEDIQQAISAIPELRCLLLSGVGRSKPCGDTAPLKPPQFQLINLELDHENVSSAQLEYFISCPNHPARLQVLDLVNVGGFSPEAFSRFLSSVAPTLCSLRIVECDPGVIRNEDKISVLDEVIGRMHSLTIIELKGRVLTPKVVSFTSHPKGKLRVYAKKNLFTEEGQDMMSIFRSNEIGWSRIAVCMIRTSEREIANRRKEAETLAKGKGFEIIFRWHYDIRKLGDW